MLRPAPESPWSASGHWREECYFVASLQRLFKVAQFLVTSAHQAGLIEHREFRVTGQCLAYSVDRREIAFHLQGVQANHFAVARKKQYGDAHAWFALKCPLLPPSFSSSRMVSMVMPRSTALHMS